MSKPVHKAGAEGPFLTVASKTYADRSNAVFTIEGPYEALDEMSSSEIAALLPTGFVIATMTLDPTDRGMGKITVRSNQCADPAQTISPVRTTFAIDMAEVTYDLVDHPIFTEAQRNVIRMWLATDESARVDDGDYRYTDKTGADILIQDNTVKKFCKAYMAGIRTFNRYYPVVDKVSTYTNPPGLSMSGSSFTGGSPAFSSGMGTYDDPPITLSGYPSGYWYKSKDSWRENGNRTWTRTEQWTYTPEGRSGDHAWIYTASTSSGGDAS